jgi:hypothetical protein
VQFATTYFPRCLRRRNKKALKKSFPRIYPEQTQLNTTGEKAARSDRRSNLGRDSVHRIGADHEAIGTARLKLPGRMGKTCSHTRPIAGPLHLLDPGKIQATHNNFSGMPASQRAPDALVDQAIVVGGTLPTHAA